MCLERSFPPSTNKFLLPRTWSFFKIDLISNLSLFNLPLIKVIPFFFQAEDGIRDRSPSRGLGDVYKRQGVSVACDGVCLTLIDIRNKIMEFYLSDETLSLIHI